MTAFAIKAESSTKVAAISLNELDRDELLALVTDRLPSLSRRDLLEARFRTNERRSEAVEDQIIALAITEREAFAQANDMTSSAALRAKALVRWRKLTDELKRLHKRMRRLDRRSIDFFNDLMAEGQGNG